MTTDDGAALFDLSDATKIELAGPDARAFLHNLCTNDVKALPVGGGCETFLTTNKARLVGHGWLGHYAFADGPALLLDTVPGQADKLLKHLDHYLISEQVTLADRTNDFALFRVVGPRATAMLRSLAVEGVPDLHNRPVEGLGFVRPHRLLGVTGFDVQCPKGDADAVRRRLSEMGATPADGRAYDVLRVEAGLPLFGIDMDENRLAMEVGRTAQAISYAKGCYLGQETIVMARDRGHANRALMGVKLSTAVPPGTKLSRGAAEVGEVTSAVESPRFGVIALAYLKREAQTPGLELTAGDGVRGVVAALPFQDAVP